MISSNGKPFSIKMKKRAVYQTSSIVKHLHLNFVCLCKEHSCTISGMHPATWIKQSLWLGEHQTKKWIYFRSIFTASFLSVRLLILSLTVSSFCKWSLGGLLWSHWYDDSLNYIVSFTSILLFWWVGFLFVINGYSVVPSYLDSQYTLLQVTRHVPQCASAWIVIIVVCLSVFVRSLLEV